MISTPITREADGTLTLKSQRILGVIVGALGVAIVALLTISLPQSIPMKVIHPKIALIKPQYSSHIRDGQNVGINKNKNQIESVNYIDTTEAAVSLSLPIADRGPSRIVFGQATALSIILK